MMHGWQDLTVLISAIACIAGLVLLFVFPDRASSEREQTDHQLMAMIFGYWLVHCLAVGLLRLNWQPGEFMLNSVKMTSVLTYFLTWASLFSLPLHRISAIREVE